MVNSITFYEVGDCYDIEGRGPFKVIARFSNEEEAKAYAIGRGNYETEADVRRKTIHIADSQADIIQVEREKLRDKALAKLTKEEREILGV